MRSRSARGTASTASAMRCSSRETRARQARGTRVAQRAKAGPPRRGVVAGAVKTLGPRSGLRLEDSCVAPCDAPVHTRLHFRERRRVLSRAAGSRRTRAHQQIVTGGNDDPPWAASFWIGCSQTGRFHGAAGAREVKEEAHGAIVPGHIDRTGATLTRMELKDLRRDALKLADWITDRSIAGVSPLSSAADLAERYRIDAGFADDDKRVDALIRWETTKNFTAGFITGLGGVLTLPITVPGSVAASWLIQARMAAAIASIYGHDPRSDRVRTVVLLALVGDASASKLLKGAGIALGRQAALRAIERVGGRTLTELNREVGTQLIAKGTVKGARGVGKLVPIAGGVVSGAFDAVSCQVVGRCAKRMFRPG
ncbi:MAG: hypothetical protein FJ260_04200 [Planctomycetes bacterium]|nr:hypothetical protein [Planctomycetota bacterium]